MQKESTLNDFSKENSVPTVLVIFGVTGDLTAKKIVPSLFRLYRRGKLPKLFSCIGFARRELSDEAFRKYVYEIVRESAERGISKDGIAAFIRLFSFHRGNFENKEDYESLAKTLGRIDNNWNACSNKLFYLAVPPLYYKTIFENLHGSGLTEPCSPEEGWTRVIVEKPFGQDLKSAKDLDLLLGKLFKEEQIYRIDHYLAKEMLQNILAFRFTNNIFEQSWNNKYIEKIAIRIPEAEGVEGRGFFYDGVGALRDVGQNHLLQMLALVTMQQPVSFTPESIREKRAEILSMLAVPTKEEIQEFTYRAQYIGFRKEEKINPNSKTETYFKLIAKLNSPKWLGVPIIIESGKRLPESKKEIEVVFKHPEPCFCPPGGGVEYKNRVLFKIDPVDEITMDVWSKKPGFEMNIRKREFVLPFRKIGEKSEFTDEYEKLLTDCFVGDQMLFVSTREIESMWKFIDPIESEWANDVVSLNYYNPGSWPQLKGTNLDERTMFIKAKIKKEVGVFGLGKMGGNIVRNLVEKGWKVIGYNRSEDDTKILEKEGMEGAYSVKEFVEKLTEPRIIWLSLPAGVVVDDILNELLKYLRPEDIIIEAGNSFYKDSIRRAKELAKKNVRFVDVGISGGPGGARYGACLMIGGKKNDFDYLTPLFIDISVPGGVEFFEGVGAGHFVKMVHNGIEYGIMQAIAEGFTVLKNIDYDLDLRRVAKIYNHGSVIEGKLVGWLEEAIDLYGQDFDQVSGKVGHTGEGEWTVNVAKQLGIKTKVIEEALKFRVESEEHPNYMGKVLSALRNRFGGHSIKDN